MRANWIRPEDLHHYEALGFDNFKIVERNTPSKVLLTRVKAYSERKFDGNFFDLVLPFNHPAGSLSKRGRQRSVFRAAGAQHFLSHPKSMWRGVPQTAAAGQGDGAAVSARKEIALHLDNRKLDGFIDRFLQHSCVDVDCEKCRYCHRFIDRAVSIDPEYRERVLAMYRDLFADMQEGSFFDSVRPRDFVEVARLTRRVVKDTVAQLIGQAAR